MNCNFIRVNQAMFTGAPNVESYGSGKEVVNVKLPSVSSTEGSRDNDSEKPVITHSEVAYSSHTPLSVRQIPDLVTLSLLPKSQWQSLINLDIIKVIYFNSSFIWSSHKNLVLAVAEIQW